MTEEFDEFCQKYDAYVRESSRMHRRRKRMDYKIWSESDPEIFQPIPYRDIRCVEIHMPEDRFRALLENKKWLDEFEERNRGCGPPIRYAQNLIDQHEEEVRIRNEHPGVMDAWQKYQTMLQLVR